MSPEITQLLAILDQAYNKPSWHGTNLRGSVRRVTPAQAAWRASEGRHNIWEIVVHAAYWKYVAARRFTGSSDRVAAHARRDAAGRTPLGALQRGT